MRLRGEHFFSRFTFTHPGLIRIIKTAAESLALPDEPSRRSAFERLARLEGINDARGKPIARTDKDLARAATLAIIARLSEAPLVSTQEERRLFELLFENALAGGFDTKMTPPSPTGCVPAALDAAERDAFVIWAPLEPAWRTALAVHALDSLSLRLIVVCADGELPNVHATFVRPSQARAVLGRARAVLDLAVNDPGDALALAELGLPLAVSYLSGAYELLDNVAIYRSWMQRDIELAALSALGLGAARRVGAIAPAPMYSAAPAREDVAFVMHSPPDATLFDNHVAVLVEALERSDAAHAVSDGIQAIAEAPGYRLVEGAFSMTRSVATNDIVVRVPRVTGLLSGS